MIVDDKSSINRSIPAQWKQSLILVYVASEVSIDAVVER